MIYPIVKGNYFENGRPLIPMTLSKTIAAYSYSHEAEMAADLLQAHGIQAHIVTDDGGGNIPGQSFVQGIMVKVADQDFQRAKEILNLSAAHEAAEQSWKCPQCGESIEGQFTECWNCGTCR